ncbi:phage tail tube protein, partial [Clostridioides difficile]
MATSYEPRNVINGTYGEVWINNEQIAECKAMKAEIKF